MPDAFTPPAAGSFLLVPSMPTPNGRLHLGHVAGPLLRLDVLARFLRSRGHHVRLSTGTDPFESHVLLAARRSGETPRSVARQATAGIVEDLAAMAIHCDDLIDPLDGPDGSDYARHVGETLRRLEAGGAARWCEQELPVGRDGDVLPRSFLEGRCPACEAWMGGSICEGCGRQLAAAQILEARARGGVDAIDAWRRAPVLELALTPQALERRGIAQALSTVSLPSRCEAIVGRALAQGIRMELTTPGTWGVPYPAPGPRPQVAYTYATPHAWAMLLGERYDRELDTAGRPFSPDSSVVTVTAFGVDITECWVVGTMALAHLLGSRGYDAYLGNEFLRLEGDKLSTSRGHVIWVADLLGKTPVDADAARYYLATLDPRDAETDVRVATLITVFNDVVRPAFHAAVEVALAQLGSGAPEPPSAAMRARLGALLEAQDRSFVLASLHLGRVAEVATQWAASWPALAPGGAYWFLKGLALVAAPLMPGLAASLWQRLGARGAPTLAGLLEPTTPAPYERRAIPERLGVADLRECLPPSLRDDARHRGGAGHA